MSKNDIVEYNLGRNGLKKKGRGGGGGGGERKKKKKYIKEKKKINDISSCI